jgi:hypothetical protein
MATTRGYLLVRMLSASLIGVILAGMVGCGGKGSLTGKVTYNNNPLPKGSTLTFISSSNRAFVTDVKSEDGSYTIDGLPVGDYKVTVKPYAAPTVSSQSPMGGKPGGKKEKSSGPSEGQTDIIRPPEGMFDVLKGDNKGKFQIPPKYLDKDSTTVSVTVKGGKQDFPITLTD